MELLILIRYVNKYQDIEYVPGILNYVLILLKNIIITIIITNQSGLEEDFIQKNFNDLTKSIVFDFKK